MISIRWCAYLVPATGPGEPWIGGWSQGSRPPPGLLPLDLEFLYLAKGQQRSTVKHSGQRTLVISWAFDMRSLRNLWQCWSMSFIRCISMISGISMINLHLTRMLASKILWSCLYACDFQRFHIQHTLCSQSLSLNDANPSIHIKNKKLHMNFIQYSTISLTNKKCRISFISISAHWFGPLPEVSLQIWSRFQSLQDPPGSQKQSP